MTRADQADQDHWDFLCLLKERGPSGPSSVCKELNRGIVVIQRIANDLIAIDLIETKLIRQRDHYFHSCWVLTEKGMHEVVDRFDPYLRRREAEIERRADLERRNKELAEQRRLQDLEAEQWARDAEVAQREIRFQAYEKMRLAQVARQGRYELAGRLSMIKERFDRPIVDYPEDPCPPLAATRAERREWQSFLHEDDMCFYISYTGEKPLPIEDWFPSSFVVIQEEA